MSSARAPLNFSSRSAQVPATTSATLRTSAECLSAIFTCAAARGSFARVIASPRSSGAKPGPRPSIRHELLFHCQLLTGEPSRLQWNTRQIQSVSHGRNRERDIRGNTHDTVDRPDGPVILAGRGNRLIDVVSARNDAVVRASKTRCLRVGIADHNIQAEVLSLLQAGDCLDSTAHNQQRLRDNCPPFPAMRSSPALEAEYVLT